MQKLFFLNAFQIKSDIKKRSHFSNFFSSISLSEILIEVFPSGYEIEKKRCEGYYNELKFQTIKSNS